MRKKPHYIKTPIKPEWEDEEPQEVFHTKKMTEAEEFDLFKAAVEKGPIHKKDQEQVTSQTRKTQSKPPQKGSNRHDIDLHGMTVSQAQEYVVHAIQSLIDQSKGQTLDIRIITGKGNHSQGKKPQLISSIHHLVEAKFKHRIIHIEVSPHELNLGGTYLKGHFDLRLK